MKNPCLEAALRELDAAGIRDVERSYAGKHLQLRWRINGYQQRMYSMPLTPSDVRSAANVRAEIRRMLRNDGILLEHPKRWRRYRKRRTALPHLKVVSLRWSAK